MRLSLGVGFASAVVSLHLVFLRQTIECWAAPDISLARQAVTSAAPATPPTSYEVLRAILSVEPRLEGQKRKACIQACGVWCAREFALSSQGSTRHPVRLRSRFGSTYRYPCRNLGWKSYRGDRR
ncbi:hypothetical protein GQ53DRAFT_16767 [Thozetella sp. PMI_491]|nr:hypothetical protein GQ53DRAFT_16767 [Thozetella sp. PMI_491]